MLDHTPLARLGTLVGCVLLFLVLPGAAAAETDDEAAVEEQAEPEEAEPEEPRLRRPRRFPTVELDPPARRWRGEPISLSLCDADLVEVLRSFAKLADFNLVLDPAVQGKVTVELRDVPWDQALYVILKSQGLGMEVSGNVWSLTRAERLHGSIDRRTP